MRGWKSVFDDEETKALEQEDSARLTRLFVSTARVAMYTVPAAGSFEDFTKRMYHDYIGAHLLNEVSTFPGKPSILIYGDFTLANFPIMPGGSRWQPADNIAEGEDVSISDETVFLPQFNSAFLMKIDLALGAAAVQDKFITNWQILEECTNYGTARGLWLNDSMQCPVTWSKKWSCSTGMQASTTISPDCEKRVPVQANVVVNVDVQGLKYQQGAAPGPICSDLVLDFYSIDPVEEGLTWTSNIPGMNFGPPQRGVRNIWREFGPGLIVPWIKLAIEKLLCLERSWDQLFIEAVVQEVVHGRQRYFDDHNIAFNRRVDKEVESYKFRTQHLDPATSHPMSALPLYGALPL